MKIEIKGIHRVSKPLATGGKRYHYYTCRDIDRVNFWTCDNVPANIKSMAFRKAYFTAIDIDKGGPRGSLSRVITEYLKTITDKAQDTQETYRIHCGYVRDKFGKEPLRYFEDPRIRKKIFNWRNSMSSTPRKADNCVGALSRILNHALNNGEISVNRAVGIPNLYKHKKENPIWSEQHINAFLSDCSRVLRWHLLFKLYTGLRRSDIISITISADKGNCLEWRTKKTKRLIRIPILPKCRALLDEISDYRSKNGITAFTILFNSRGKPWTTGGINASSRKQRMLHNITMQEHRLRGNFVTLLCIAGFSDADIAYIMGWEKTKVSEMRRIYVDQNDIIMAQIVKLNSTEV
ncbi:MAG: hypothetical protein COA43_16050 [Robiginitomaculum sp.]|nr:MAG: hypothetical protein COA43_16050 [Robiginitomaculum sp.]